MSSDTAPSFPDPGAGLVARVSALLCDVGLLLGAWALSWTAAAFLDPGAVASVDVFFSRYAFWGYLPAASIFLVESPGQRLVGLRILDAKYSPLSRLRVLARSVVFLLTLPLCLLNLPLLVFTRQKRALHDLATHTKVMVDPSKSPLRVLAAAVCGTAVAAAVSLGLNLAVRDRIELHALLPERSAPIADPTALLLAALTPGASGGAGTVATWTDVAALLKDPSFKIALSSSDAAGLLKTPGVRKLLKDPRVRRMLNDPQLRLLQDPRMDGRLRQIESQTNDAAQGADP